jgi:hypothetical protein
MLIPDIPQGRVAALPCRIRRAGCRTGCFAGLAANDQDGFPEATVVVIDVDLTLKVAAFTDFQSAFDGFRCAGGHDERRLALRTEAAVLASAIGKAANADRMMGGIVE